MKIKPLFAFSTLALSLAFSASSFASDHGHREHKAHEHGHVSVNVVVENDELQLELDAPSFDLVGYGHYPRNLNEKITFNRAMTILKNPKTFFAINASAHCSLTNKDVHHSLESQRHKKHKHEEEAEHSEFEGTYSFKCKNPDKIKDIKFHWWKSFSATEKITVVALTDKGTKTGTVTAKSRRFYFK